MDRAIELINNLVKIFNQDTGEYLNLVGDDSRSQLQVLGDDYTQIDGLSLLGVDASNSDNGKLYWKVTLDTINHERLLEIYKDSAKTQMVAKASSPYTGSYVDSRLVYHNLLNDAASAQNPVIGNPATLAGTSQFSPVHFDDGVGPLGTGGGDVKTLTDTTFNYVSATKGRVDMWVTIISKPVAFSHGIYELIGPTSRFNLNFNAYEGLRFQISFGAGWAALNIPWASFESYTSYGVPMHLAFIWNKAGIGATTDKIAIYIDGVLRASSNSIVWGTTDSVVTAYYARGIDANYATPRFIIDNVKMWNEDVLDYLPDNNEYSQIFYGGVDNGSTVNIEEVGGSGITGKVKLTYISDDIDSGNLIYFGNAIQGRIKINDINTGAISNVLEYTRRLSVFLLSQLDLGTCEVEWLDFIGTVFYGIPRLTSESDSAYSARIIDRVLSIKLTSLRIVEELENFGDNVQLIEGIDDGAFSEVSFSDCYKDFSLPGEDVVKAAIAGMFGGMPFFFRVIMENVDPADYADIIALIEDYRAAGVTYIVEIV